jgi:hypothetical protein
MVSQCTYRYQQQKAVLQVGGATGVRPRNRVANGSRLEIGNPMIGNGKLQVGNGEKRQQPVLAAVSSRFPYNVKYGAGWTPAAWNIGEIVGQRGGGQHYHGTGGTVFHG